MADEVNEVQEDTQAEQPVKKPRRKRRTKAQIEADNAAKQAAKSTNEATASIVEENKADAAAEKQSCPIETLEISKEQLNEAVESQDSASQTRAESATVQNNSFKGTLLVHEAPYEGSYAKKLCAVFTPIQTVNGFVQVAYVRHGFGVVRGYVTAEQLQ